MDRTELCETVLAVWNAKIVHSKSKELERDSEVTRIMRKQLKYVGVDVDLPDELCVIVEACTAGNPERSLMMLKDILDKRKGNSHVIMPTDFTDAYPEELPIIVEGNKWETYFKDKWNQQRCADGKNYCNTHAWWVE